MQGKEKEEETMWDPPKARMTDFNASFRLCVLFQELALWLLRLHGVACLVCVGWGFPTVVRFASISSYN